MFFGLLLAVGCAKHSQTSDVSLVTSETLQAIDLELEFGTEVTGWTYSIEKWTLPIGSTALLMPPNVGWAIWTENTAPISGKGSDWTAYALNNLYNTTVEHQLLVVYLEPSAPKIPIEVLSVQRELLDAPQQSNGVTLLESWKTELPQFPMPNKALRYRAVEVSEGGSVGLHSHESRPSFAYVVHGTAVEHRGDRDVPHPTGGNVAERNGLRHWWEVGSEGATIVVFDIVDAE